MNNLPRFWCWLYLKDQVANKCLMTSPDAMFHLDVKPSTHGVLYKLAMILSSSSSSYQKASPAGHMPSSRYDKVPVFSNLILVVIYSQRKTSAVGKSGILLIWDHIVTLYFGFVFLLFYFFNFLYYLIYDLIFGLSSTHGAQYPARTSAFSQIHSLTCIVNGTNLYWSQSSGMNRFVYQKFPVCTRLKFDAKLSLKMDY